VPFWSAAIHCRFFALECGNSLPLFRFGVRQFIAAFLVAALICRKELQATRHPSPKSGDESPHSKKGNNLVHFASNLQAKQAF
jgi:hypothetical protein